MYKASLAFTSGEFTAISGQFLRKINFTVDISDLWAFNSSKSWPMYRKLRFPPRLNQTFRLKMNKFLTFASAMNVFALTTSSVDTPKILLGS